MSIDPDIRRRYQYVDNTRALNFAIYTNNGSVRSLVGEARSDAIAACIANTYIPNMSFVGANTVRLDTPESARLKDKIPLYALRIGETAVLDRFMTTASQKQYTNIEKDYVQFQSQKIGDLPDVGSFMDSVKSDEEKSAGRMSVIPISPGKPAAMVGIHVSTFLPDNAYAKIFKPDAQPRMPARPSLAIYYSEHAAAIGPSLLGHELDHVNFHQETGLLADKALPNTKLRMELQGYSVSALTSRALAGSKYPYEFAMGPVIDANDEDIELYKQIDNLSKQYCPPDDPSQPNARIHQALWEHGLAERIL